MSDELLQKESTPWWKDGYWWGQIVASVLQQCIFIVLCAPIVMGAWNRVMPEVFSSAKSINFAQAIYLQVLVYLISPPRLSHPQRNPAKGRQ